MSAKGQSSKSRPDRLAAALILPFVVLWDVGRWLMFGLFSLAERLDPFAFGWRVLKRLAPPVVRFWRTILPTLITIREVVGSWLMAAFRRTAAVLAPLLRRLDPALDALGRQIKRLVGWLAIAARRALAEIREKTAPLVNRTRSVVRAATAPVRWVVGAVRRRSELARSWVKRVRSKPVP